MGEIKIPTAQKEGYLKQMKLSTTLSYYKNPGIRDEIIRSVESREVAIRYGEKGFGRRPDILKYPADILELAKQGATSFHCSEEIWRNPLHLSPGLQKKEIEDLRVGWDLVLDIDCKFLEYSKIASDLVVKALKHHGVESVSCKFSGNHGFHIGVPFKSFPEKVHGMETRNLFPEGPRRIAFYLKKMIKEPLAKSILETDSISLLIRKTGKKFGEIVKNDAFDPFSILDIDTILISQRHLYRTPYSLNEKSGLVSLPINPRKIMEFDKVLADPGKAIISRYRFLDKKKAVRNDAIKLIVQSIDSETNEEKGDIKKIADSLKQKKEFSKLDFAIPEKFFPPCIKKILKGVEDGRKRCLFALTNFLSSAGWDYEAMEKLMAGWNERNGEQLREVLVKGQLRYHKQQKKNVLPPNCSNRMYYKDMGVCSPDTLCSRIRNPVNYAIIRARAVNEVGRKGKKEK